MSNCDYMADNSSELISNDSSENFEQTKRSRDVTKLKYSLPNGKLEPNHRKILIMSFALQTNGHKSFKYDDFSENALGFSNTSLSSTFKFFVDIGLMESLGKAHYKLTEEGHSIAKKLKYNQMEDAKSELKDLVIKSWFYKVINTHFSINDSAPLDELVNDLAFQSNAEIQKHKNKLKVLIDYLEFIDIVRITDDEIIVLNNGSSETEKPEVIVEPTETTPEENVVLTETESNNEIPAIKVVDKDVTTNFIVDKPSSSANINVDISINLEITPEMTSEDIKSKLDAIISSFQN